MGDDVRYLINLVFIEEKERKREGVVKGKEVGGGYVCQFKGIKMIVVFRVVIFSESKQRGQDVCILEEFLFIVKEE